MTRKSLLFGAALFASLFLGACSFLGSANISEVDPALPAQGMGPQQNMGPGSGSMSQNMGPHNMGARHHVMVPEEFAGLTNPIPADDESLARGAEIYVTHCATCHGDYGNGDGSGGASLDPVPAPIAHTSQMMSDAYLFWRITEGGISFETGMLPFRDILDEQERWDVINFVRALGRGEVHPRGPKLGGQPFDPDQEQNQRTEMLAQAIGQGVISQAEADIFDEVHATMDEYLSAESAGGMNTGPRADTLPQILETMVLDGLLDQDQADTFLDVHDRLLEAELMQ